MAQSGESSGHGSGDPAGDGSALLLARKIVKDFPGIPALDEVDFDLRRGEVHILFGENGAGKSTLSNIFAGALQPDSGTIWLEGAPVDLRSVADSRRLGISAVFQEFSLAPDLSVAANIFLGAE